MRFIGTIEAKVDNKGRVFLPATFRRSMQATTQVPMAHAQDSEADAKSPVSATKGPVSIPKDEKGEIRFIMRKDIFEDCLVLYTEDVWYARLDELRSRLSVWNRQEQAFLRKFVTDAEWISLDSNGRFLIPKRYLKMAGIENEVTFIGMDSTIELWSKQKLESQPSDEEFADGIESLMKQ